MNAKEIYREFSRDEPSLPIFSRDWWLDATAGADGWDVVLVRKEDQIVATMPYMLRQRYGMRIIGQPALTQTLGPWVRSSDARPAQKLGNEKDLMQALIDQLPPFDHFSQCWHYSRTNWLPFSWNGFRQTTRYTYVLPEIAEIDQLWSGFESNTRTNCKKASSRFKLTLRDDLPIEALLDLNRMTFARQGLPVPYTDAFVRRLDAACAERGCRKFWIAVDPDGRYHAGSYIVWDENSSYGLINGADPALRNSGATSLCIWEAIRHASRVTRRFDFTGSMIESVERLFRGFGATQVPYFSVSKTPSRLLRVREGLLSVMAGE